MIKNISDLRQQYPELVTQIENDAINGERSRIKAIDEISNTIHQDLINKAKYDEPMTAQDLAFEALKVDGKRGQDYRNTRDEELGNSGGQNVGGGNPLTPENDQENAAIDKIVNSANKNRKGDKN